MEVRPPRAVFVDYPAGRTFGLPGEKDRHEKVLEAALSELPRFTGPGQIRDLSCQWEPDGNRSWEAPLREEVLKPLLTGAALEKIIRLQSSTR
jgi:hypothetical protein